MRIFKNIHKVKTFLASVRKSEKSIGFIPTMGALHQGHLSLIRAAKKACEYTVVSIFVNPIQFGPREDLARYPREEKKDRMLLREAQVDLLFCPSVRQMYPCSYSTYVDETMISRSLCGVSRPGHFKGVCTVVMKLFHILNPDIAFFGKKDYQQGLVVARMVKDLNMNVKIKMLPIVREPDGLAMSSRNRYLSVRERKQARVLFQSLSAAKHLISQGQTSIHKVKQEMLHIFAHSAPHAHIEYIEFVNLHSLQKIKRIQGRILIALAVKIGKTRLIDNIEVTPGVR